jgi:hypothetical protein
LLQQPPAQLSRKTAALIKKPHFSTASVSLNFVDADELMTDAVWKAIWRQYRDFGGRIGRA